MTEIALTEYGRPLSLRLADDAGRALARSGLIEASPDANLPGHWRLRAKNTVGVAAVHTPTGEKVTVRISPKVPIARLLFMLGYSRSPKGWRSEHVPVGEAPELVPVFARIYALQAEEALRRGVLEGYRETEEAALVLRGKVRHADQVSRRHGLLLPVEITYDAYTNDIAENRLLRTAGELLLRVPGGIPADARRRLLRQRLELADVPPIPRGHPPPAWFPGRLNARYHHALRLADLALRGASVEHRPGDVIVHGFLFNLAKVFEDFVTVALREALAARPGHDVLQATHHLDERDAIRIVPDYVRYAPDGSPCAVADAKYKAERRAGFPDADLYQMLAYCTALDLREGHLVYAKGEAPYGSHRVRHAGITIHQHALDLDQPPSRLLADIRAVAERLGNA